MADKTTRLKILGDNESRKAFRQLRDDIGGVSERIERLDKNVKLITGAFIAFQGAVRPAFQSIKNQLSELTSTGARFEVLQKRLDAVAGSAEAGAKSFDFITEFTKTTPLQLDQVTDAFTRLKAFGLDPMDGTLQAITDGAIKYTGSAEGLQGVALAVGQAWAKQKLQGEEILQLVERGIPVWELLEKVTGKNARELGKLSEKGELGRKEIALLVRELGRVSAGAAADQMETFNGQLSNAQDNIQQFRDQIAKSGFLDFLTESLQEVNKQFADMRENGQLAQLARDISESLVGIARAGVETVRFFVEFKQEIGFVIRLAAGFVAIKIGAALVAAGKAALFAAAGFRALLTPLNLVLLAFAAFETVRTFWPDLFAELIAIAKKSMFTLVAVFQKAGISINEAWDKTALAFENAWTGAIDNISNWFVTFVQAVTALGGTIAEKLGFEETADKALAKFIELEKLKVDPKGITDGFKKISSEADAARQKVDDLTLALFRQVDQERDSAGESVAKGPVIGGGGSGAPVLPDAEGIVIPENDAAAEAAAKFAEVEKAINEALKERSLTLDEIQIKLDAGIITQTQAQLEIEAANRRVSDQLTENIAKGREFAKALSGSDRQSAVVVLENAEKKLKQFGVTNSQIAKQINGSFATGLTNAFDGFISGTQSAGDAFRRFASDFLRQIAQMIVQQTVLNAISGGASGGAGGVGGAVAGLFHDGGVVGSGGKTVKVPAFAFAGAPRYHSGGIAGLAPNEVPAVLERGEEVLTRDDPRHIANQGSPNVDVGVKNVNVFDSAGLAEEMLNTPEGEKVFINWMRKNRRAMRGAIL